MPTSRTLATACQSLLGRLLRGLLWLRYSVTVTGLDSLAPPQTGKTGILILPNHPALIDPVIVYSHVAGLAPHALADTRQMQGAIRSTLGKWLGILTIPDIKRDGRGTEDEVKQALQTIIATLQKGENVLLYPAGRLYRKNKEDLRANSAVATILQSVPDVRVLLVRSSHLWGSSFSYASGKEPMLFRCLLKGIGVLLANALLFTPRRKVEVTFKEPTDLPRTAPKKELNQYLEHFYNQFEQPLETVPYFHWLPAVPKHLPQEEKQTSAFQPETIPPGVKEKVYTILQETLYLEHADFLPEDNLAADLGLDSLALMDIAMRLETEFGHPLPVLEKLNTVADCMLAATGRLFTPDEMRITSVPTTWFNLEQTSEGKKPLIIANTAPTLVDSFLALVRQAPCRPYLADKSGVKNRWEALLGAVILARHFQRLPGQRLGIMLPATPVAHIAWLAALLAGKEPVMINWTVGSVNMTHAVNLSGIQHIITAQALLDTLKKQGILLDQLPVTWVTLEHTAASLSLLQKLRGIAICALHVLKLPTISTRHVPTTAAILFTSGSEAAPKGVPLTHSNIMANAADLASAISVLQQDRLLAMLPPFHSFGLLLGMALPAASGLQTCFHPNPTEAAPLSFLTESYKPTLCGITPTFLEAMLQKSAGTNRLASLRCVFAGAEKCPEHVYALFQQACPGATLSEAYGITECSPAVSVNQPPLVKKGSIGKPLPSVHIAIVATQEGSPLNTTRVAPGTTGLLLIRGPNVFSGYLGQVQSPFIKFEGHDWYNSGDLVYEDQDHFLFFAGRLKRFIKIGGEMISLPQLETVLQQGLSTRADLPADGSPFIAVEADPDQAVLTAFTPLPITAQELTSICLQAGLSSLYSIKQVVPVERIPVLGTGKTDYVSLKALLPDTRNEKSNLEKSY